MTAGNNEIKGKAFMKLAFKHDKRIYAYIFTLVPNNADAEDIFQETMAIMWEKFDQYKEGENFGSWGVGIAYNIIRNFRKKKARSKLVFEEDIESLLSGEAACSVSLIDDRIYALRQCLKKLHQKDIEMLVLRYEQNTSVKDIARKKGQKIQRIYAVLARLNDRLLRCIRNTMAIQETS